MPTIIIKTQADLDALPDSFKEFTIIELRGGTQYDRLIVKKARESSHVVARESSHVVARESSHVVARESSHVEARESSHVEAWGSSHVVARGSVAVHNHSVSTTIELFGFAVAWFIAKSSKITIRSKTAQVISPEYKPGVEGWMEKEGIDADRSKVILFKRVSAEFKTQEGKPSETVWSIGLELTHPKWNPTEEECGAGKYHACSRGYFCDEFRSTVGDRYIAIQVDVADLHAWDGGDYPHKIAFRKGVVLHECDKYGVKKP